MPLALPEDILRGVNGAGETAVLLASCIGESTGGGLVAFDGSNIDVIDHISTTGMTYAEGNLHRLLWCRGDLLAPSELLIYDATGIKAYHRLDEVRDPHDIMWDGSQYIIVSSGGNSIFYVSAAGEVDSIKSMPGEPDSWHINSLCQYQDRLFVSAFGRFARTREWLTHYGKATGIVFDLCSGEIVLNGLEQPHHPKRLENGDWLICNSGKRELLAIDATSKQTRRVQLEKWTRGLATTAEYIFVGESARRKRVEGDDSDALASIAIVDRNTLSLIDRIPLPFEEIYELLMVPQSLLHGLRQGFRTNPQRVLEQNQHSLFDQAGIAPPALWAVSEIVPVDSCAITVTAEPMQSLTSDSVFELSCTVKNSGYKILVSAKPQPVSLSYRWVAMDSGVTVPANDFLSSLPGILPPGGSLACKLLVRTPSAPGSYLLEVSLFQKTRGFFGDLDNANMFRTQVSIS